MGRGKIKLQILGTAKLDELRKDFASSSLSLKFNLLFTQILCKKAQNSGFCKEFPQNF